MKNKIENVIIIGAMKSGTSSLYSYLRQHPEICSCITKEPEFFSRSLGKKQYKIENYFDLFKIDPNTHKFTLEASTGYTKFPAESGVPKRIKEYGLNPKFIYILRNPIDRIKSHYNFMQEKNLSWKNRIDSPHLINTSNYYLQLQEYNKYFPIENILILDFEDLKNDPKKVCQDVFQFIGASEFNTLNTLQVRNVSKPYNRGKLKLRQTLDPYRRFTPSFIKKPVKKVIDLLFIEKQKQLTKKQKEKIFSQLKPDMDKLKKTYNFDVSKWGF